MKWFSNSVPESWQVRRLKRAATLCYGDSLAVDERKPGDIPVFGSNGVVGNHDQANLAGPGLVVGRKGSYGKVTYTSGDAFVIDTAYGVDQTCSRCNLRWLFYALLVSTVDEKMRDSPVPGLASRDAHDIQFPLPPLDEQQRIAAYLDASCAAIDQAIDAKRKQRETLDALRRSIIQKAVTAGLNSDVTKEDSGVDYLGEMPVHWKIAKLKRLLDEPLSYGLNESGTDSNPENPRYIRITDFGDDGFLKEDTFRSLPTEIAADAPLVENDILLARSGATVGKSFIFRGFEGPACYAGYLIKARASTQKLMPEFLYLYTKSSAYESWKDLIFTQATIPNISAVKYAYLEIPVPPVSEQADIVRYLDCENKKVSRLQEVITQQITTLIAYRKSLIHECVTGQRRISDADVQQVTSDA